MSRLSAEETRNLRDRLRLSQEELASELSVARRTLSTWETGTYRTPAYLPSELRRLARKQRTQAKHLLSQVRALPGVNTKQRLSGADFAQIRKRMRLSHTGIATLLDVAPGTVRSWETEQYFIPYRIPADLVTLAEDRIAELDQLIDDLA